MRLAKHVLIAWSPIRVEGRLLDQCAVRVGGDAGRGGRMHPKDRAGFEEIVGRKQLQSLSGWIPSELAVERRVNREFRPAHRQRTKVPTSAQSKSLRAPVCGERADDSRDAGL